MNSKYSNLLTILLVVIIIAIIGIIGFLGYSYFRDMSLKNNAEDFVDSYIDGSNVGTNNNNNDNNTTVPDDMFSGVEGGNNNNNNNSTNVQKYNGFTISGTIEIPATNLKCPIIAASEYSNSALETSVVELYGPGVNQVGNTTIAGHNWRNGVFFSNNKKLNIGDKIYITDLSGKRLSYTIYNKYQAKENESDYMTRDTQGAIEVSLTTCTDDTKARIIIWAKADV